MSRRKATPAPNRPPDAPAAEEVLSPQPTVDADVPPAVAPFRVRVLHRANVTVDKVGMIIGKNDIYTGYMAAVLWRDAREHVEALP